MIKKSMLRILENVQRHCWLCAVMVSVYPIVAVLLRIPQLYDDLIQCQSMSPYGFITIFVYVCELLASFIIPAFPIMMLIQHCNRRADDKLIVPMVHRISVLSACWGYCLVIGILFFIIPMKENETLMAGVLLLYFVPVVIAFVSWLIAGFILPSPPGREESPGPPLGEGKIKDIVYPYDRVAVVMRGGVLAMTAIFIGYLVNGSIREKALAYELYSNVAMVKDAAIVNDQERLSDLCSEAVVAQLMKQKTLNVRRESQDGATAGDDSKSEIEILMNLPALAEGLRLEADFDDVWESHASLRISNTHSFDFHKDFGRWRLHGVERYRDLQFMNVIL